PGSAAVKLSALEAIFRGLEEASVRYLVVGGVAVKAHGYQLARPRDLDDAEHLSWILEDRTRRWRVTDESVRDAATWEGAQSRAPTRAPSDGAGATGGARGAERDGGASGADRGRRACAAIGGWRIVRKAGRPRRPLCPGGVRKRYLARESPTPPMGTV